MASLPPQLALLSLAPLASNSSAAARHLRNRTAADVGGRALIAGATGDLGVRGVGRGRRRRACSAPGSGPSLLEPLRKQNSESTASDRLTSLNSSSRSISDEKIPHNGYGAFSALLANHASCTISIQTTHMHDSRDPHQRPDRRTLTEAMGVYHRFRKRVSQRPQI